MDEINADLDHARTLMRRTREAYDEAGRRVVWLEGLVVLAGADSVEQSGTQPLHKAILTVLKDAPMGMMRAGDLAAEINRRGLYRMQDGRPVEPQQIHARVNNYGHMFDKEGTFIKRAPSFAEK
jgi:hypothetical protein